MVLGASLQRIVIDVESMRLLRRRCRRLRLLLDGQRWWRRCRRRIVQHKAVVDGGQLDQAVLLEAHEAGQRRRLLAGTAHAVDDVALLLLAYEQNVEDFELVE